MPASVRMRVDLPVPFGPSKQMNSPARIAMLSCSKVACLSPLTL